MQTIERQSGIFIGERNVAIGWGAHAKENQVIGKISGQSNLLLHNLLILNDPDHVDTPIDDRDINLSIENPGDDHTTELELDCLNIHTLAHSSTVFLGRGHINGVDGNGKMNYSQGSLFGSGNHLLNNFNLNYDEDLVDGLIHDQDIKLANIERD